MRLTYDSGGDSLRITLRGESAVSSGPSAPDVAFRLDAAGNVVAIDIARASQLVDLTSLDTPGLPIRDVADGKQRVVGPGDVLSAIAAEFGTTVAAIVAANNLADPDRIFPGQVLTIPAT